MRGLGAQASDRWSRCSSSSPPPLGPTSCSSTASTPAGAQSSPAAAGGTELAPELRIWRVPALAVAGPAQGRRRRGQPTGAAPAHAGGLRHRRPTRWSDAVVARRRRCRQFDAARPGQAGHRRGLRHRPEPPRVRDPAEHDRAQRADDRRRGRGSRHGGQLRRRPRPNNGVGIVGVYPEAVLRVWDASPFGFLNEGAAIEGIYEAARRGPGVINLSFGGEDDDPLLDRCDLVRVPSWLA